MKNKGFTLIELLASIVILGILMTVALPNVFRIMTDSRADTYIDNAKKLISNAEYKMRVNSDYIKRPTDGKCVIMTMSYLDGPEFDAAPEGGQYNRELSYVVIKANGNKGNYTYYVNLLEDLNLAKRNKAQAKEEADAKKAGRAVDESKYTRFKASFKGISLTEEKNLKAKNARGLITGIAKDKVIKVKNVSSVAGCSYDNTRLYSLDKVEAEDPSSLK